MRDFHHRHYNAHFELFFRLGNLRGHLAGKSVTPKCRPDLEDSFPLLVYPLLSILHCLNSFCEERVWVETLYYLKSSRGYVHLQLLHHGYYD